MAENLEGLWQKLTLTEEDEGVVIADGDGDDDDFEINGSLCLIGTLLSLRPFNFEALKNTMIGLWKPIKGLHMRDMGNDILLFQFNYVVDKMKVVEGCPWFFDRNLFILQDYEGNIQSS